MKEELIKFETAKIAKEKGLCHYFNSGTEYVNAFYSTDGVVFEETEFQQKDCIIEDRYFRPTQSLLQKWLREICKMHLSVDYSVDHNKYSICGFDEFHSLELNKRNPRSNGRHPYPYKSRFLEHRWIYNSYEEALEQGLLKALKLI